MTPEIRYLLLIVGGVVALIITEKVPADLAALFGLMILTLAGYLTPEEAVSGFSSAVVVTMFGMFFLSAALRETGVAERCGSLISKVARGKESFVVLLVMLVTAVFSAFMPNIAAAALMLPVAVQVAGRTGVAPSRLLIPVSFAAILGGLLTIIGTQANVLVSEIMGKAGLAPFRFFEFTPFGVVACLFGILFMVFAGRHLLPRHKIIEHSRSGSGLTDLYRLHERLMILRVPSPSSLHGQSLAHLEFGGALKARVVGIERRGKKILVPEPQDTIEAGDLLTVEGRLSDLEDIRKFQGVRVGRFDSPEFQRFHAPLAVTLIEVNPVVKEPRVLSSFAFLDKHACLPVAVKREGKRIYENLQALSIHAGDQVVLLGLAEAARAIPNCAEFVVKKTALSLNSCNEPGLFVVRASPNSGLAGASLEECRFEEIFELSILAIERQGNLILDPPSAETIFDDDLLLVMGEPERVSKMAQLGELEILQNQKTSSPFESPDIGIIEVIIPPRSQLLGRTMREIGFRVTYGFQVLAIWRDGEPKRTRLANLPLKLGDALLLQGPRRKIPTIARNPDFVLLTDSLETPYRRDKALFAVCALLLVILLTAFHIQPVHIAALIAALFCVFSGSLTPEHAYRNIEWRILIAVGAMLPIGIAIEKTGAATLLAQRIIDGVGTDNPYFLLVVFGLLASLLAQLLDGTIAIVLLAPIVLKTANQLHLSPYPLLMGIAVCASIAFMTPMSHKANLLVVGAGGYKASDFLLVGTLLSVLLLVVFVLVVPFVYPF